MHHWTGLTLLNGFPFLVNFFFLFILGRAVDKAGLTASFRAHVNIISLLTYLLIISNASQWIGVMYETQSD